MEQDYLTEVSNFFLEKKGRGAFLAPKDIMLIQDWYGEGIPVSVAMLGIEQTFLKADSGTNIDSVFICDRNIRDIWRQHNSSMEGINVEVSATEESDFFIFEQAESFFQKKLTHASEDGNVMYERAFKRISEGLRNNKQIWVDGDFFDIDNEGLLKEEIEGIVFRELCFSIPEDIQSEIRMDTKKTLAASSDIITDKDSDITECYIMKNKIFSHFSLPKSPFWFI